MVECLDAGAVQELMAGTLDDSARRTAMAHLDGCDDCRDLLAQLARDAARDKGPALLDTVATDAALARTADPLAPVLVPAAAPSGRAFGRYTLVERIGAGAMGSVYRATDPELGRSVALKLLHRPDPTLTDRLVREARSMAQVSHPNVVAIFDVGSVGVADGATYIAMELVEGRSLRAWQRDKRPLAEVIAAYIAAGRGLAAAHAAGIVHRDFKPDNVLVGADGRVRVTDFGLAAARATNAPLPTDLTLTAAGAVVGTPAYMAPEQLHGGNVEPRTDQFSFCVALHEAAYGQRPFEGTSFEALADAVIHGRVRPAPAGSRVSGALRAIILRGLAVKPGDRFPTMDHLLVELGRDRATPWRRAAIAAAAVAIVLGIGTVADLAVHARVSDEIRLAFAATGRQTDRAWRGLTGRFDAAANQVYFQSAMREVSSNRDQADFGLGDADADRENLDRIHAELASADWTLIRELAGRAYPSTIAVLDYKGRMLYTSAAPNAPRADLMQVPWIARAFRTDRSIALMSPRSGPLARAGLFGPTPPLGLGFFYARALVLNGETGSALVEEIDASALADDIRLDDETKLSIVAPDGTAFGDVSPSLARVAMSESGITESPGDDGLPYQVQAVALRGFDDTPVGHVVMARATSTVLALFPGARLVFALAMVGSIAVALGASRRARQIARS